MGKTALKLKLEKISALSWWDQWGMDLYFWIWSSTRQNFAELKYSEMLNIINKEDAPLGKFPEGKAYFSISPKLIPWDNGS